MRIIIACEYSGIVRDAFIAKGHDAISCDLLPTDRPGPHWQGDIFECLQFHNYNFDFLIGHPPCTFLTGSAEWAYKDGPYHQKVKPGILVGQARRDARIEAISFAKHIYNVPIAKIVMENPIGTLSRAIGKPSQIIQPYQFGEDASKATCLWLKGLPLLIPTSYFPPRIVNGKNRWSNQTDGGQNKLAPSADRWARRSDTFHGIANAMADQWG